MEVEEDDANPENAQDGNVNDPPAWLVPPVPLALAANCRVIVHDYPPVVAASWPSPPPMSSGAPAEEATPSLAIMAQRHNVPSRATATAVPIGTARCRSSRRRAARYRALITIT